MVADQGRDPNDDKDPSTHAKLTPQKQQTPESSNEEPKVKIESFAPASARRHDSPMPRSPLQHTQRDKVAMHGSRPGVATSQDTGQLQQMSLEELIELRQAERDTNSELAKAQRRLERISQRMGWSPMTTRTIEQLAHKKHAARGDEAQGTARKAHERDNEQHESSDDSNDEDDTSSSEGDTSDEPEEPEPSEPIDDEIREAEAALHALYTHKAKKSRTTSRPKTKEPTKELAPSTGSVARIKALSDAEVRKHAFEPTRARIGTDFVDAVNFIGDKHTALDEWRALIDKPTAEVTKILATSPHLQEADLYYRTALGTLVTKQTEDGRLFANEERKIARDAPSSARTGVALALELRPP